MTVGVSVAIGREIERGDDEVRVEVRWGEL